MAVASVEDLLLIQLNSLIRSEQEIARGVSAAVTCVLLPESRALLQSMALESSENAHALQSALSDKLQALSPDKECPAVTGLTSELIQAAHLDAEDNLVNLMVAAAARKIRHAQIVAFESAITLAEVTDDSRIRAMLENALRMVEQGEQALTILYEDTTDTEIERAIGDLKARMEQSSAASC